MQEINQKPCEGMAQLGATAKLCPPPTLAVCDNQILPGCVTGPGNLPTSPEPATPNLRDLVQSEGLQRKLGFFFLLGWLPSAAAPTLQGTSQLINTVKPY